jgi:hypothetical protein
MRGLLEQSARSSPGELGFLSRRFADELWKEDTVANGGVMRKPSSLLLAEPRDAYFLSKVIVYVPGTRYSR